MDKRNAVLCSHNEKNEIVILDFEDWMYAPSIVEYPTICFELLKEPQIISDFFENIASTKKKKSRLYKKHHSLKREET